MIALTALFFLPSVEAGLGLGFANQIHAEGTSHPSTANCTWKYITQVSKCTHTTTTHLYFYSSDF